MSGLIHQVFVRDGVTVDILRLDKINALAPGNKWFKLAHNIAAAKTAGAETLLSFGGAFSNHLHAMAAIAKAQGFAAVACVRADPDQDQDLSPTLQDAVAWGMQLHYLSRSDYRRRHESGFVAELMAQYPKPYFIPEGGGNALGAQGCRDIVDLIPGRGRGYAALILACGTGTSLAGISAQLADGVKVIGIPVLKAQAYMADDIQRLQLALGHYRSNWELDYRFHGGAYARVSPQLGEFIVRFEAVYKFALDPVYTAKMMYALESMIDNGEFAAGTRLLAIHTGGLQGRRGYPDLFRRLS